MTQKKILLFRFIIIISFILLLFHFMKIIRLNFLLFIIVTAGLVYSKSILSKIKTIDEKEVVKVSDKLENLGEKTGDKIEKTVDTVTDKVEDFTDRVKDTLDEK